MVSPTVDGIVKLVTVVGARPQFIKAGVVSRAIESRSDIAEVLVHTGQHFDRGMSHVFFIELGLPEPAYHLGIGGLGHAAMTGRMLERLDDVIVAEKPDAVLVYGDTNSTLAAALAAAKRHVPLGHVEAGVRSFRRSMPEEINRVVTDRLSRWLFCPSLAAMKNLAGEGIVDSDLTCVANVGDVMYDASLLYRKTARMTAAIAPVVEGIEGNYYLATIHREENVSATTDTAPVWRILAALDAIARDTPVLMPLHPRTRNVLAGAPPEHIRILEPVSYFEMIALLSGCRGVFTDSGGLQKEAYYFGKPCVTLREETEWVELVEQGANLLAGTDPRRIFDAEESMRNGGFRIGAADLYGDGHAADRILDLLAGAA